MQQGSLKIDSLFSYSDAFLLLQFQQIVTSEGGARAEARTLTSSGGKRENGEVAIHSAVRRACLGDKKAQGRG